MFGILSETANFYQLPDERISHHKEDCVLHAHAHVAVELSVLAIIVNYY